MPSRLDSYLSQTTGLVHFNGGGTNYLFQTPAGVLYKVFVDNAVDVVFKKSTDGGLTWGTPTSVFAGTVVALSCWYDRDSNVAAGKIHCAYSESGGSDVLYRSIDTEAADALATQTTIFNGVSTAAGGGFSITKTRGGNLLCYGCIDAGAEPFFARSVDNGANWTARGTTGKTAPATQDQYLLVPGFAADNQDAICLFWDASANAILKQLYDDSGDVWTESTLASSFTDSPPATAFPNMAAAVDLTNSKIIFIAWNNIDVANADLQCWSLDDSSNTAKTDVVTNSTDDQGLAGISIDTLTGWWWAFYVGKSDGSETLGTAVNLYCKVSKDSGSTWSAELKLSNTTYNIKYLATIARSKVVTGPPPVVFHHDDASTVRELKCNAPVPCFPMANGGFQALKGGI